MAILKKTPLDLAIIQKKLLDYPKDVFDPYIETLLSTLPNPPMYIVGYGSCLSSKTKSITSVPDFYVVVDQYKTFFNSRRNKFLSRCLPPSIFHFHQDELILKYCVISRQDLNDHVQISAPDIYHIGRFSKRIALTYALDTPAALEDLSQAHINAMTSAYILSRKLATPASKDDAILNALAISYTGDIRVEADDKVKKIFLAEGDYYTQTFGKLFDCEEVLLDPPGIKSNLSFWIRKSRFRSSLRWFKNILTAKSWIDYMIFKIERTKGIKIEITQSQKKWWFIHIWPILWHLKKNKMLK